MNSFGQILPIDVWDFDTFDPEICSILQSGSSLVKDYYKRDLETYREYETAQRNGGYIPRPTNEFSSAFQSFVEGFMPLMKLRTIRVWHYTRLTDSEVANIKEHGIKTSTPDFLRQRLDEQVIAGNLTYDQANYLFQNSPFHGQYENRFNMFWFISKPTHINDGGVKSLLNYWGGEVASFWLDDNIRPKYVSFGCGRVLECAVPLSLTDYLHSTALAIVSTFGRSLECRTDKNFSFDLNIKYPLGPECILDIHSEGESLFDALGKSYPYSLAIKA